MVTQIRDVDGVNKLVIYDGGRKIRPQQIGVYSKSGTGKSLLMEGLREAFRQNHYIDIVIGDGMKGEEEPAYANFLPREKYHLNTLDLEGITPKIQPTICYHPFTFSLPKSKIPEYEIFTVPIKNLNRREYSMLAETTQDSDTIRLLLLATQNLSKSAGIYQFLHDVQDLIKGKKGKGVTPSIKNFFLSVGSGTAKSMQDISNLFQPFKQDYFLSDKNSKYNLDWKKILTDDKNTHFFSTKFLKDDKQKEFLMLLILDKILENKDYLKQPIVISIPEIRKLCPDHTSGYKKHLSEAVKEALSTMRNMGAGFSSITDSQSYADTDQNIRDSHSLTFLGALSLTDVDKISKVVGYDSEQRRQLVQPEYSNSWTIIGKEQFGSYHMVFPSHCHAEPKYRYEKMFAEEFPNRMTSYKDLIDEMTDKIKYEEEVFREKVRKEQEAERIAKKRKEEKKKENKKRTIPKDVKEMKMKQQLKDYERAYKLRVEQKMTLQKAGELLEIGKDTVDRWVRKYKKYLREKDMTNNLTEPENVQ